MEAYFDNSATTCPCPEAAAAAAEAFTRYYGNPSSLHAVGTAAQRRLEEARETAAKLLRCESDEILINLNGPVAPAVMLPTDGDSFLYLILPVRIKN